MRFVFLILAGLTLLSCGGKTRSSETEVKVLPDEPIVIAADSVRAGVTIPGPWFQYSLSVTNNDSSAITIAAIKVTIMGVDSTGAPLTTTGAHTAGELDSAGDDTTNTPECKYVNYKPIAPNSTDFIQVDNGVDACKHGVLFIDANAPGGKSLPNYNYRVKLELIGWFGPDLNPEARFQKIYTFSAH